MKVLRERVALLKGPPDIFTELQKRSTSRQGKPRTLAASCINVVAQGLRQVVFAKSGRLAEQLGIDYVKANRSRA